MAGASFSTIVLVSVLATSFLLQSAEFACAASSSAATPNASPRDNSRPGSFFGNWRTARSLLHSLLARIANHRLARGDTLGAERIKHLQSSVDNGVSFWKSAGSIGWDYLINYSWRTLSPSQIMGILRLAGELQAAVSELVQLPSDIERIRWISANYDRLFTIAKTALGKMLDICVQSGAIRNFVLSVQKEVVSGDILRDALQLGASDLQSLLQVAKDMLWRYYGSSNAGIHPEL